jgi:hypothetical protein
MRFGRLRSTVDPSSPDTGTQDKEQAMSRYEKRIYFEWLVTMRVAYATLGADDRTPIMTVDEAIAWAEAELDAPYISGSTPATEA